MLQWLQVNGLIICQQRAPRATFFISYLPKSAKLKVRRSPERAHQFRNVYVWACPSEGSARKLAGWWIVKHQLILSSTALILNQQEVINVSKCLILIIISLQLQWLILGLLPELQRTHQALSSSAETLRESLAAHISREILTAAPLFLFQCTG